MNSDLLSEAGAALYGPRWQSELARAINVSDRTIRRWLANDDVPPATINSELLPLLEAKAAEANTIARKIRRVTKQGDNR